MPHKLVVIVIAAVLLVVGAVAAHRTFVNRREAAAQTTPTPAGPSAVPTPHPPGAAADLRLNNPKVEQDGGLATQLPLDPAKDAPSGQCRWNIGHGVSIHLPADAKVRSEGNSVSIFYARVDGQKRRSAALSVVVGTSDQYPHLLSSPSAYREAVDGTLPSVAARATVGYFVEHPDRVQPEMAETMGGLSRVAFTLGTDLLVMGIIAPKPEYRQDPRQIWFWGNGDPEVLDELTLSLRQGQKLQQERG